MAERYGYSASSRNTVVNSNGQYTTYIYSTMSGASRFLKIQNYGLYTVRGSGTCVDNSRIGSNSSSDYKHTSMTATTWYSRTVGDGKNYIGSRCSGWYKDISTAGWIFDTTVDVSL